MKLHQYLNFLYKIKDFKNGINQEWFDSHIDELLECDEFKNIYSLEFVKYPNVPDLTHDSFVLSIMENIKYNFTGICYIQNMWSSDTLRKRNKTYDTLLPVDFILRGYFPKNSIKI